MKLYAIVDIKLKIEIPDDSITKEGIENYVNSVELPHGYFQNSFRFKKMQVDNQILKKEDYYKLI
jgi:hypothetical protein